MTSDAEQDFNPDNLIKPEKKFICGVIEGFYGRPWTTEQRKDLFRKLKRWGMDSYVYAPKDDYKHRAYWREMYTVEEADHLTSLIAAAKEHNIVFYYALSPGLDMTYSNPKEVSALKRKLDQVSQFGCDAFALLFDDIEPEMSKADKEVFQSFGQAQVSVTNEVYNHLNCSRFLFCPTQYCSTRAQPTVANSEYLNTIGSKLVQDIDILWTGPKVISKNLSVESIQEVTEVMRRPPVIWDNLHANDYDQKRVFLGPYAGRSPELIPLLRGVLTNPNCEFHANHIAIHTLAHWSKCSADARVNNSISADIKLETENEEGICGEDAPTCLSANVYHPRVALKNAINEWLPEFYVHKEAWGPITKPHPIQTMVMPVIPILPSINTCMSLTTTTSTVTNTTTIKVPEVNTTQLQALAEVCSNVTGADTMSMPNVVMNSLVSPTKVITNDIIPNPIVATLNPISLPQSLPLTSIGVPVMNVKTSESISKPNDDSNELDTTETEDEKFSETKKSDELMPVEDDSIDEMAHKIEENIVETDVDVAEPIEITTEIVKANEADALSIEQPLNKNDGLHASGDHLSSSEPMECASVNSMASPKHIMTNDVIMAESVSTSSTGSMQVESSDTSLTSNTDMHDIVEKSDDNDITVDDLFLLCDLFYLPFEHGSRSLQIINEFYWLKTNANLLVSSYKKGQDISSAKPEVQEWFQRADKFYNLCQSVVVLAKRIASCANKELCYDLYSYVWDIAGVITLLCAFIKWLSLGYFPVNINSYTQGNYTWFSKGWRETFSSGDQEPWVFRGGLMADLQRLIPVDSGNDLFIYKMPDSPTTNFYTMRPYSHMDESQVYEICHKTCRDGSDCTELFPEHLQSIPADRLIGPFVTINPELCLVLQNGDGIVSGYACAALDAKQFYQNQEMCWLPEMRLKYPLSLLDAPDLTPAAKDSINHFHNFKYDYPQEVLNSHPSIMVCSLLKEQCNSDSSLPKRLVTVLLAALRSNGSFGVHVCINSTDRYMHQFYSKLGFSEIYADTTNGRVYLGRNF